MNCVCPNAPAQEPTAQAKAAESGKPANIVEKMVEGSVQKYLREVTLLGQPFVKDDKQTVEQLLKGRRAQVHAFRLYSVGEGLEKRFIVDFEERSIGDVLALDDGREDEKAFAAVARLSQLSVSRTSTALLVSQIALGVKS